MTEAKSMKLVCEMTINGQDVVKVLTTANTANQGSLVKIRPGVGKPFWMWNSIPAGTVIGADFTGAPVVSDDVAVNNANIQAITANPADVLIYE